ncbi:Fibronectin type III [uncultured Caudovirales phage]|uniref:Fibronectin type III n=1 Tax=uncultured Caudovirales phage TaxID=2100421 RepID=A0A6J5NYB8_9CAUD|nr:Fibronectin type III [uncultured Caudovirales phage]
MAIGKRVGKKSQQANDFLEPQQPTITSATNVGTGRAFNNGAVDVAFTLPANSPAATGFTVTSNPGSLTATGATSPLQVTGLLSDTSYTFTVVATNASGNSIASAASSSVTVTTIPATPSAPTASSPNADQDQISWSAPANGGSAITNYYWESTDGKSGNTGTATNASLGQEPGTAQQYKVLATNANGNSEFSALSNSVTTTFSFVPFGVFGFSPFTVFGFSPFNVFGFSPFRVFGFSPFRVFGFSPTTYCVDEDAPVLTTTGNKKAKDIELGDKLIVKAFEEMPVGDLPKIIFWKKKGNLTNYRELEADVTKITPTTVHETVMFNNNPDMRFSLLEDMFVIKNGMYQFISSRDIKPGDKIITRDSLMVVETVEIVNETRTVYSFGRYPIGLVIAGGLVHYNEFAPEEIPD